MNIPTLTVVLPTHNRPDMLSEALASIARQTYQNCSIVVVDDFSNPVVQKEALIKECDRSIKLVNHKTSLGGAEAKNTGVRESKGEIIAFLDDDDLYDPTYLERAVSVFEKYPEIEVIFMGIKWFGSNAQANREGYEVVMKKTMEQAGGIELDSGLFKFDSKLIEALLSRIPMSFQRPVLRRSAWVKIGPYQHDCLLWDCDFAIRASIFANCAILTDGLYLQRAEGQGYFSQPDRLRNQHKSNIEIKTRLLASCGENEQLLGIRPILKTASSDAIFDLAYYEYGLKQYDNVVKTLQKFRIDDLRLRSIKLYLKARLMRMFENTKKLVRR